MGLPSGSPLGELRILLPKLETENSSTTLRQVLAPLIGCLGGTSPNNGSCSKDLTGSRSARLEGRRSVRYMLT